MIDHALEVNDSCLRHVEAPQVLQDHRGLLEGALQRPHRRQPEVPQYRPVERLGQPVPRRLR